MKNEQKKFKWLTHYINEDTPVKELYDLIKKYSTLGEYSIDELRFKTKVLRFKFQGRILDRFAAEYENSDLRHNVDWVRLYSTPMDNWKTPNGIVVISDVETIQENEKK